MKDITRNSSISPTSGSNVRKTQQHTSTAKEGADWNATNEQKQYVPSSMSKPKLGGRADPTN